MTRLQAEIKALVNAHPIPHEKKLASRITVLERMTSFYESKAPESQDGGVTFMNYVRALLYAATMIKMYRKLTRHLAQIAEETDENRTDS